MKKGKEFLYGFMGVKRHLYEKGNPRCSLEHLRTVARCWHEARKELAERLRNPVNRKTEKPLSPSTMKRFRHNVGGWKRSLEEHKRIVRYLVDKGFLGPNRNEKKCRNRARVLTLRKIKYLFSGIQELKTIEGHLLDVLQGQQDLNKVAVWKVYHLAENQISKYSNPFGCDLTPTKKELLPGENNMLHWKDEVWFKPPKVDPWSFESLPNMKGGEYGENPKHNE